MAQLPTRFNLLPEVIKNLMIINGLFFLATVALDNFDIDLQRLLGLYLPGSPVFKPFQIVTHLFMHADFEHVLMNMLMLWFFGSMVENYWGGKRFLNYYLLTGFGAAALHYGIVYLEMLPLQIELLSAGFSYSDLSMMVETGKYNPSIAPDVNPYTIAAYASKFYIPTLGASGAVYGILMAAAMTFPNQMMFPIPIKVKHFALILGVSELIRGVFLSHQSNIAHFAHLGGMLFGYLLIRYWRKNQFRQH